MVLEPDWANFTTQSVAVNVNLSTGTASGQGTDSLAGIENVRGSNRSDTITGDANANELSGDAGNDTLSGFEHIIGSPSSAADTLTGNAGANTVEGLAGRDAISGANGSDTVTYSRTTSNVIASLVTKSGGNATVGQDSLSPIENLTGGLGNDTFIGGPGQLLTPRSLRPVSQRVRRRGRFLEVRAGAGRRGG